MGKQKNKLAQSIYNIIEKKTNGKMVGASVTLRSMKSGELNPTDRTIANLLRDNGIEAKLTLSYEGCEVDLDFTALCNEK